MRYFQGYTEDKICAIFDNDGKFVDFKSSDDTVPGIFISCQNKSFPCCICANEITDEDDADDSNFGCQCCDCGEYFHNSCCSIPMKRELYDNLTSSPAFVKILCPSCNNIHGKTIDMLTELQDRCKALEEKIDKMKPSSYAAALNNNDDVAKKITSTVVKQLKVQSNTQTKEETDERNKRTVLIRRPESKEIKSSKDLRSAFNKEFPGKIIRMCRVTAGGSFKIELDKESEVKEVKDNFKDTSFGGNSGIASPEELHTSGIIKHAYEAESDEVQFENYIKAKYGVTKVEFFKPGGVFRGTVKLTFSTRQDLLDCITNRIQIFNQRYLVEEFKPSPRVIKCNRCQGFGHIARRCFSKEVKCGNCGSADHETTDCTSTVKKCCHCGEGHAAGDKNCDVMKKKLDEISQRFQYGQ